MKKCLLCLKQFKPNSNVQKFCNECRVPKCVICAKSIEIKLFNYKQINKFCSKKCRKNWNIKKYKLEKNCEQCSKVFIKKRQSKKYCSQKCQWSSMRKPRELKGEKHWNWQGGKSEDNYRIRNTSKYRDWRLAVYQRDHFTCQHCKEKLRKGNIVAHHIKSFADYIELRFDVGNGVTLCRKCHAIVHKPVQFTKRMKATKHKLRTK